MKLRNSVFPALGLAGLIGLGVTVFSRGPIWVGWLAAAILLLAGLLALISLWRWAGGENRLAWMLAAALLLRLALGTAISLGLPIFGYNEPEQKAGYLFYDAYMRDNQAWDLARSGQPLWKAFGDEFTTDQYGGLLGLSALVYRVLSPDAHRPQLILILGALFFTLGVPFFYRAVRERWGARTAALAGWILVLYPDGILFSSSQMREPFLIGLLCITFWGVISWGNHHRAAAIALIGGLAGMLLFSTRVAAAAAGVLAVWFFLDHYYARLPRRAKMLVWVGFALLAVLMLVLTWEWFSSSAAWDLTLLDRVSGQWKKALQEAARAVKLAALALYGLTRPLLPAAIATVRPPWIWKTIDIFRSAGWWALLPLLVYSGVAVWKEKDAPLRRTLLWFAAVTVVWLLISSLRGGADQWDNPRYRTIFLPFLALLAGYGVNRAVELRDAWLPRLLVVEAIFLAFFTQWYLSRYWTWLGWKRMTFWNYVIGVALCSILVVAGGWLWDRWRAGRMRR